MAKKFLMLAAVLIFAAGFCKAEAAAFDPRFVTVDILANGGMQLSFNFSGRNFGSSGDFEYRVSRLATNKKVAAGTGNFRYGRIQTVKFKYSDLASARPEILRLDVKVNSRTVGTKFGAQKLPRPEIGQYSYIIKFNRNHKGQLTARISYGGAL